MIRCILLSLMMFHHVFAGFEQSGGGARSKALAGAFTAVSDDAWALFCNAGGLTQLRSDEVSFHYSPQPFGLKELSVAAVATAFRTSFGTVGFGARTYGSELYREISATISYATSFDGISTGVAINYHTVAISRYGSAGTIGVDIGALVPMSRSFRWGLSAKNINAPVIGAAREKLPQIFSAGVSYTPLPQISLSADCTAETGFDLSPRSGFEYWISDAVALRAGYAGAPSHITGGLGFRTSQFLVDYAFSNHEILGWTHEASITIRFGGTHD